MQQPDPPNGHNQPLLHAWLRLHGPCDSCLRGKEYSPGVGQVLDGVGCRKLPAHNLLVTEMTPRDVPILRGKLLRMCGDVGVGEQGPTPNTCDNDAAWRHWVEFHDLGDIFHEGAVGLLENPPLHPLPQRAFALPTLGEVRICCLFLSHAGVEQRFEVLPHNFVFAVAPRFHYLVPPHLAILSLRIPPKHNVAVPIN